MRNMHNKNKDILCFLIWMPFGMSLSFALWCISAGKKTSMWCVYYVSLRLPTDEEGSRHVVVNCSEALLKNNTYWPLVSDFINILSHQSVAKKFLEDHSLLMLWMSFVSVFQGKKFLCSIFQGVLHNDVHLTDVGIVLVLIFSWLWHYKLFTIHMLW